MKPVSYTRQHLIGETRFTAQDMEQIGRCRREHNRLGFAYRLAFVRLYNRFPSQQPLEVLDELLAYVSVQLEIESTLIKEYSRRLKTISEHHDRIRIFLGLQRFGQADTEAIEKFIFEQACRLEQTHALMAQVKEFLSGKSILQPADSILHRIIQQQRQRARQFIFDKVSSMLNESNKKQLDGLLVADKNSFSALHQLKQTPNRASPSALLRLVEKLEAIIATGILKLDFAWLNNNMQRSMARYAKRLTATRLRELKETRRYTVLVCFLRQLHRDTTDDLVRMYDKLMNQVYNRSQLALDKHHKSQRKVLRTSLYTFKAMAEVILDESIQEATLRQQIFERVDKDALVTQVNHVETWLNGKYRHVFSLLVNSRFSYIRQFAPALLEHLKLELEDSTDTGLLEAVELLRQMNASGKRKLPQNVPIDFMPKATQAWVVGDNGRIDKSSWECALLTAVRDHIKSGNVAVQDSKRFGHLDDFFMPVEKWQSIQGDFFRRAGLPARPEDVPGYLTKRLNQAFDNFLHGLPQNSFAQVDENGWSLSKDAGEKLGDDTEQRLDRLKQHLSQHMRVIKLPQLMVEVDNELHFSRYFMSPAQQQAPGIEDVCATLATIIAHGCNIGPYTMSHLIDGITYHRIKHISDWLLTEEAQRGALAQVVNAISRLDISQAWGEGKTSSSDGQRFALRRKVLQQAYSPKFNDFALEFYSFIADNYAPYHGFPIECTDRDAPYVLDGLLYNESDLALEEHYTDTHGYTENNFAAFAMLGRRFCPRIRGLHRQRIYRIDREKDYGPLAVLVDRGDRTIHMDWIVEQWHRMGHFYASLESGHTTASVALRRLNGYTGKNHFYRANRELGRIFKTEHILRYMSDKGMRVRTRRGLLKGEQLHTLARDLNYGKRGRINKRDWLEQRNSCSCLTLILACIVYWQAKEIHRVLLECPSEIELDLSLVEHISPITWDNVILYGEYVIDRRWIEL
ncbi:MAG: Tn3 family transposase [Phycisphaerae bacterium]|nr:Tn3 family transposase [Phycisphaerae bacterium]NIX32266.1 Tn3 family transposase [Phycisphaerae bacterium]